MSILGSTPSILGGSIPSPPKPPVPEIRQRDFSDAMATRQEIYGRVLDAARGLEPISNRRHTLRLTDVDYDNDGEYSIADQKKAILGGKSLHRRLKGTWELLDNETGSVLDRKPAVVAHVPYFSNRGTMIHNGNEYTLSNQLRLRPGIFTRVKENGEIESHVNILPGKGSAHRYFLDPAKGVFKMRIGQANIPLMPLVRAMGASDAQLREAWGNELYAANAVKDDPASLKKLYQRLVRRGDPNADTLSQQQAIAQAMQEMRMDGEINRRTLGKAYDKLDLETILATTKKLLAVSRGEQEVDDRDHLAFQTVLGPEDLLAERIAKDYGGLRREILRRASFKGDLKGVPSGALSKQLQAAILNSGLGQPIEEINLAEVFDKQTRITRLGEGGIGSLDAIPDEARSVQPSHLAFMDPVRTPECYDAETEVMTKDGWKPWPEVGVEDKLACLVDGQLEFHWPRQLTRARYVGKMYGASTKTCEYLVTPNHRMYVRRGSDTPHWCIELAEDTHEAHTRIVRSGGHEPAIGFDCELGLPEFLSRTNNSSAIDPERVDLLVWAEFVGWYLSEGSLVCNKKRHTYGVDISQHERANPENCRRLYTLLDQLPFSWSRHSNRRGVRITGRHIYEWAKPFGKCYDKFIPPEAMNWPTVARRVMLESLLLGDGRRASKGTYEGQRTQFCSTSERLAADVQRLAFSLGIASRITFEPDPREERFRGCWVVNLHSRTTKQFCRAKSSKSSDYYTVDYDGVVYCASVPGGLLYVRRNNKTGFWCGNSLRAGVDINIAGTVRKGSDGRIYAPFIERKTGKLVYKSPQDTADMTIAFPGEMNRPTKRIGAMRGGKLSFYPKDEVDLIVPHFENAFSALGSMVPMKSAVKAQRMAMASRMFTQALPVQDPEAPLVQSGVPGEEDKSFEELFGERMGAVRAQQGGRVLSINDDGIKVRYEDGKTATVEMYNNFPFNRKTQAHNTPVVRPGDTFKPGDLLARSNFTDANGTTAIGKNARVAYLPFRGLNFEDAVVVSESFAKRMSSEHMYQRALDAAGDGYKTGKRNYTSLFGAKYDKSKLDMLDDDGVVKPGQVVKFGDPLVLAAKKREDSQNKVHKRRQAGFSDATVTWDHHADGVVTDVYKGKNGSTTVLVKAAMPMQVGDKLSGRFGDKGVLSAVVPDDEMPKFEDGQAAEVLLSPLGVISRVNPAQIVEGVLGAIAAKTGKPYKVKDFEGIDDLTEFAIEEARKHNINPLQQMTDPQTGRGIKHVFGGNRWFMKLHHTAESKGQGRGTGGYTMDDTPSKGIGSASAKRVSMLDSNALLSHGATAVMQDAGLVRGQRNEDYWLAFMQGVTPPKPKVPFVYQKFLNQLRGSGVNVIEDGAKVHIMAMTDKDIETMAGGRELKSGETVKFEKGLEPIPGGLFDKTLTGGHGGDRWSMIRLAEPMPNPVMEEPIRRLLGLTGKKFEAVLAGTEELGEFGGGPQAIVKALSHINLDRALENARAQIASGRKTKRDEAVRRLKYLKSAKRLGIHPKDWVVNSIPVIPPKFRPVATMSDRKLPLVADPNFLYKEAIEANNNLRDLKKEVDDVGEERSALYKAFQAVTGLADPVHPKLQEKRVKGFLSHIFGNSPKYGAIQRRLLSSTVDVVGRGVITPNPDLDMDHVGLPEDKAWDIYNNFVARRLRRRGMPLVQALKEIDERTSRAKDELLNEMQARPVIINRAPVLHKFGMMAFYPKLVKSNTLEISPLIVKGFNADFDGDAMQYHVPASDDAVQEAVEKMLPSRNLLSPADFRSPVHQPSQDYTGGLYAATAGRSGRRKRTFRSKADMLAAYRAGEINIDDDVEILIK